MKPTMIKAIKRVTIDRLDDGDKITGMFVGCFATFVIILAFALSY